MRPMSGNLILMTFIAIKNPKKLF